MGSIKDSPVSIGLSLILVVTFAQTGISRPLVHRDGDGPAVQSESGRRPLQPILRPASGPDTLWFGGTSWDPVDERWEAVPGGVWTFDSGVASTINSDPELKKVGLHSSMEGWVGLDKTTPSGFGGFRRLNQSGFDGSVCVGAATGILGGDWSYWCGYTDDEASSVGFAGGRGYGNWWDVAVAQTFGYQEGAVQIAFSYTVDLEQDYDFVSVRVDTGSGEIPTGWQLSGQHSGRDTLTLEPGGLLPLPGKDVTFIFRVVSDGSWSDEDGINATACGAFGLDDIVICGGICHTADFESGDDGWEVLSPPSHGIGGDWSDIRAVADLPGEPGVSCDLGDSVLVFIEDGGEYHGCFQHNVALSPWIDVSGVNLALAQGFVVEYGGYFHDWFEALLLTEIQWSPLSPTYPELGNSRIASPTPGSFPPLPELLCASGSTRLLTQLPGVPAHARAIRVVLGIGNGCGPFYDCICPPPNSSPWFNDVRFGIVMGGATTGIPPTQETPSRPMLGEFSSNPLFGSGTVSFYLPLADQVRVEVFDILGRSVVTLADGRGDAGVNRAAWDGTDRLGRPVPSGVYFYRLSTPSGSSNAKRVIVIR